MEGRVSPSTAPADDDKSDDPPIWSPLSREMATPVHASSATDRPSWRKVCSFNTVSSTPTNPSGHWRRSSFSNVSSCKPNDASKNWRKLSINLPIQPPTPVNSVSNDPPGHWRRASFNGLNLTPGPPSEGPPELETYVVQVPKDQIYRVPPPENAKYVEKFQNTAKNERSPHCRRFLWVFVGVIALLILIGAVFMTLKIVYSPKAPTFTIVRLSVRKPIPKLSYDTQVYKIWLKLHNPNDKAGLDYSDGDGGVKLYFKNRKLGEGVFPVTSQDVHSSSNVYLELADGLSPAPTIKTVALVLKMDVKLDIRAGSWRLWSKSLGVTCDMKVTELGGKSKILSQKCLSELK